jgi:hypothetical protein
VFFHGSQWLSFEVVHEVEVVIGSLGISPPLVVVGPRVTRSTPGLGITVVTMRRFTTLRSCTGRVATAAPLEDPALLSW